jgi:ABC-type phosphate transport system substrate-binding protein
VSIFKATRRGSSAVYRKNLFPATISLLTAVCFVWCPPCQANRSAPGKAINLKRTGATFPHPLYSKQVVEYGRIHPNVRINYQSVGSGGDIRQITEGTVGFG